MGFGFRNKKASGKGKLRNESCKSTKSDVTNRAATPISCVQRETAEFHPPSNWREMTCLLFQSLPRSRLFLPESTERHYPVFVLPTWRKVNVVVAVSRVEK